jgi:hypothetical protein
MPDDRLHASYDVDGRPSVDAPHDDDPLLTALIKAHPDKVPASLLAGLPSRDAPRSTGG